jgi:hypothetical protein
MEKFTMAKIDFNRALPSESDQPDGSLDAYLQGAKGKEEQLPPWAELPDRAGKGRPHVSFETRWSQKHHAQLKYLAERRRTTMQGLIMSQMLDWLEEEAEREWDKQLSRMSHG